MEEKMNIIKLSTPKNADGQRVGPTRCFVATTTDGDGEQNLGGVIRASCEIEILRGETRPRAGGGTIYRFVVDDEKARQLSQLVHLIYFRPNANPN